MQGILTTLKYIPSQTHPQFCYVQIAKSVRLEVFVKYDVTFGAHPSHFLLEPLYTKAKEHVRGANNPSHIPHITLTSFLPLDLLQATVPLAYLNINESSFAFGFKYLATGYITTSEM